MAGESLRNVVERNVTLWFLGTLFTGTVAGMGLMRGLEDYSGMVLLTKREDGERQSALESCKQELSSRQKAAEEAPELAQCKAERSEAVESQEQFQTRLKDAAVERERLEARIIELDSVNRSLRSQVSLLQKPSVHVPPVIQQTRSIPLNRVISYLGGALNLVVESYEDGKPCIRLALAERCTALRVGDVLPVQIGDKTYGIRADSSGSVRFPGDLSLLLIKREP